MDNKIVKMLILVDKINKKGGRLLFSLNDSQLDICDGNKGFEKIIMGGDVGYSALYFKDWFKDDYEKIANEYLEVLNRMWEEIK